MCMLVCVSECACLCVNVCVSARLQLMHKFALVFFQHKESGAAGRLRGRSWYEGLAC